MNPRFLFSKLEATGNDFVFIDSEPNEFARRYFSHAPTPQIVVQLCAPHTGIGADGCVFLWAENPKSLTQEGQQWRWSFYNGDGSPARMCGNATRAAGRWLQQRFPHENQLSWMTEPGLVTACFLQSGWVRTQWPIEEKMFPISSSLLNELEGIPSAHKVRVFHCDTGVPHLVVVTEELLEGKTRMSRAPALRRHASLGVEGSNVTFVGRNTHRAVTFERGVEGETLACGSGALAAFLAIEQESPQTCSKGLTFAFPGGGLCVDRHERQLRLSGPARLVFEGDYRL